MIKTQQGRQLPGQGILEFIKRAVCINHPPDPLHDVRFFLAAEMGIDLPGKLEEIGAVLAMLVRIIDQLGNRCRAKIERVGKQLVDNFRLDSFIVTIAMSDFHKQRTGSNLNSLKTFFFGRRSVSLQ